MSLQDHRQAFAETTWQNISSPPKLGKGIPKKKTGDIERDGVPPYLEQHEGQARVEGKILGHQRLVQNVSNTAAQILDILKTEADRPTATECVAQLSKVVQRSKEAYPDVWKDLGSLHMPMIRNGDQPPAVVHVGNFGVPTGNMAMPNFHMGRLDKASPKHNKTAMFININPTLFPSNSAYNGRKLGESINDYAAMIKDYQADLKKVVLAWKIPLIATHHEDAAKLFKKSTSETLPIETHVWILNDTPSAPTLVVASHHRDHILKALGCTCIMAALENDYLDLLLLNVLEGLHTTFPTNALQYRAYCLAIATLSSGDDYATGRFLSECEKAGNGHNLPKERVESARNFYVCVLRKHGVEAPVESTFTELMSLLSRVAGEADYAEGQIMPNGKKSKGTKKGKREGGRRMDLGDGKGVQTLPANLAFQLKGTKTKNKMVPTRGNRSKAKDNKHAQRMTQNESLRFQKRIKPLYLHRPTGETNKDFAKRICAMPEFARVREKTLKDTWCLKWN